MPEGEKMRRAVRWISAEKEAHPERSRSALAQEAELKFDLTPKESMYLHRLMREEIKP